MEYHPFQPGDVPITYADITSAAADLDYRATTRLAEGLDRFVDWYRESARAHQPGLRQLVRAGARSVPQSVDMAAAVSGPGASLGRATLDVAVPAAAEPEGRPRIAVIGSGYVGTVVAAGLASIGCQVTALEVDETKLRALRAAKIPFYEGGLEELLASAADAGHIRFTADMADAVSASDVMFICVGTPGRDDGGGADLRPLENVARALAPHLDRHHDLVLKSTVPIGTGRWLTTLLEDLTGRYGSQRQFSIVNNPEFLREGSAVSDFLSADRVVLGSDDPAAIDRVAAVYRPILEQSFPGGNARPVPLVRTTPAAAEMAKYASNSFLATRVSFINEIANLCDHVGADVTEVAAVMGLDVRIGSQYLDAGIGWGGSCFAKDLNALVTTAQEHGLPADILRSVIDVNSRQRERVIDALTRELEGVRGKRIGLLGLAFKAGTDDLRDAPAVEIAVRLVERGAVVTAYDPMVDPAAVPAEIRLARDPYEAASRADAVILATEWPELVSIDLARLQERMNGRLLLDGRNVFNGQAVRAAGLRYVGVGRPKVASERILDPA
jgi:nucleotide sugar dehydrogenase